MAILLISISLLSVIFFIISAGKADSKLAPITPSLCVTIGIFFTFFGIALSLQSLEPLSNSQEAFEALLVGLKSAFWSSVIGLGGSIFCRLRLAKTGKDPFDVYAMQTNSIVDAVIRNGDEIVDAINGSSQVVGELLSKQLFKDSRNISKQFNNETEKVLSQFTDSINKLVIQSDNLLSGVNESIQHSQATLDSIVTTSKDLNEVNRKAMRDNTALLYKCVDGFNNILKKSDESLLKLTDQSGLLHKELNGVSSSIVRDFEKVQLLYQSLNKDIKSMEPSMDLLSKLVKDLKLVQVSLEHDHKENMAAAVVDFKLHFQKISKEFDELNQSQIKQARKFFESLDLAVEEGLKEVANVYASGLKTILADQNKKMLCPEVSKAESQLDGMN